MKKLVISAILLVTLTQSNLFARVTVKHGDMTITLPSEATASTTEIVGDDGEAPSVQHRLAISKPEGAIIVWHQEDNGSTDHKKVFDGFRDTLVRMAGAEAVHDRSIPSWPARMLLIPIPAKQGVFRVTYFHFNGRYYQVMAVGSRDFVMSEAVTEMLVSPEFEAQSKPEDK